MILRWLVPMALAPVAVLLLSACTSAPDTPGGEDDVEHVPRPSAEPRFNGTLLDSSTVAPTPTLRDTDGQPFSLASRPTSEVTVLFFGYTHCPDVCPTTMADLAAARSQLPTTMRENVTVAFVTEDPARDTNADLRRWLNRYDPSFVGVRGGNRDSETILRQLHLPQTQRIERPEDPIKHPTTARSHHDHGDSAVSHTGVVYVFGPGDRILIYTGGTTPPEYAEDFARLLSDADA